MELILLDKAFEPTHSIDVFESLVWTDRYNIHGDFVLRLPDTSPHVDHIQVGKYFRFSESDNYMRIETKKHTYMDDFVEVSGRALTYIYEKRALGYLSGVNSGTAAYVYENTVANVIRGMVNVTSITPDFATASSSDKIPGLVLDPVFPTTPTITVQRENGQVWEKIQKLANEYNLGLKLTHNPVNDQFYFTVYEGLDRSLDQNTYKQIVFDESLDNLQNVSYLESTANEMNVVWAVYKRLNGNGGNYPISINANSSSFTGWDRAVTYKDYSDTPIDNNAKDLSALMGRTTADLSKLKKVDLLDGSIINTDVYKYGTDYNIGDLVSLGLGSQSRKVRITEHIWSINNAGVVTYPTFSAIDS